MELKILLWINLSLFILHEMDAIYRKEWLMLYPVNRLSETTGHYLFTGMHFFLFLIIFYMLDQYFYLLFWLMNFFGIFHLAAHIIFRKHRFNYMNNFFSMSIVFLMAIVSIFSTAYYFL